MLFIIYITLKKKREFIQLKKLQNNLKIKKFLLINNKIKIKLKKMLNKIRKSQKH